MPVIQASCYECGLPAQHSGRQANAVASKMDDSPGTETPQVFSYGNGTGAHQRPSARRGIESEGRLSSTSDLAL